LRFQWWAGSHPQREINVDANLNDCQVMLDNLTTHYNEGRCPGVEEFVTASRETNQPLVSGQSFEVALDTLEDAMKMKKMADLQWGLHHHCSYEWCSWPG